MRMVLFICSLMGGNSGLLVCGTALIFFNESNDVMYLGCWLVTETVEEHMDFFLSPRIVHRRQKEKKYFYPNLTQTLKANSTLALANFK